MIGFWIVNLVVPGEPEHLLIKTPAGTWTLDRVEFYSTSIRGLQTGQCAHTYAIHNPVSMTDGAAACERAMDEMTPLLLGASYLTGLSVTAKQSVPYSDARILQPSSHWPRERSMANSQAVVNTEAEFISALERFVAAWPGPGQSEKVLLLVHHWLDALACWSFEDMYLSATTLLQIIAATEETRQGRDLSYFNAVSAAATRAGIPALGPDFKDMRNNLIHEGKLLGGHFSGASLNDCASVAAGVLNWFDTYIHTVLALRPIGKIRFSARDFLGLNAYSV